MNHYNTFSVFRTIITFFYELDLYVTGPKLRKAFDLLYKVERCLFSVYLYICLSVCLKLKISVNT